MTFFKKRSIIYTERKKGEKNDGNINHTRNSNLLPYRMRSKSTERKNLKKLKKVLDKPNKMWYNVIKIKIVRVATNARKEVSL